MILDREKTHFQKESESLRSIDSSLSDHRRLLEELLREEDTHEELRLEELRLDELLHEEDFEEEGRLDREEEGEEELEEEGRLDRESPNSHIWSVPAGVPPILCVPVIRVSHQSYMF